LTFSHGMHSKCGIDLNLSPMRIKLMTIWTKALTASVCIGWDTKKRLATRLVNTLVPNFKQNSINRTETRV